MIAAQYISQGYPVGKVLAACRLSASRYYYRKTGDKPGRRLSRYTLCRDGKRVPNEQVVQHIQSLLERPFVDYGYIKVTWWLRYNKGYIINFKKVYRLMKENRLLNPRHCQSSFTRKWARWSGPEEQGPLQYWQFDIKYVYVAGKQRNGLLLTVLDVNSRWVLGSMLRWSICKEQVKELFSTILCNYGLLLPELITVRSDNGSQFIAKLIREFLAEMRLIQEFTQPATPQQNGHIEAWHSIVERSICQRLYLQDLAHGQATMQAFVDFYNNDRIHSGLGYKSPKQYLHEQGIDLNQTNDETKPQYEPSKVEYLSS